MRECPNAEPEPETESARARGRWGAGEWVALVSGEASANGDLPRPGRWARGRRGTALVGGEDDALRRAGLASVDGGTADARAQGHRLPPGRLDPRLAQADPAGARLQRHNGSSATNRRPAHPGYAQDLEGAGRALP